MRFSPTLGARRFLRQVLSQLQVRRRSTGTAVTGGENQLVVDELGFAAVPFGAARTRAGVSVCSTRLHEATIPHLGNLEVSPPDQTLCRMAPLRHVAPRNDSVVALHFNGPAVAKQRMLRVWGCWQRRLEHNVSAYETWQGSKIRENLAHVSGLDKKTEQRTKAQYASLDFRHRNVLCIGSRGGGEVRAFASMGAFAVGIDVAPAPKSTHVLYGNAMNLEFATESVD